MGFCDELFEEVKEIWGGYINHPFIIELGEGTLPLYKFKEYLIEDYLYLKEYTKVFALGIIKSKSMEHIKFHYETIKGILEDENAVHINYLKDLEVDLSSIDKKNPSFANLSYTSYMMSRAVEGGLEEVAIATMPCAWSYYYIGSYLKEHYDSRLKNNYYTNWIKAYSSEEYKFLVDKWIEYIDNIAISLNKEKLEELKVIFKVASMHEMEFWNMAYEKQEIKNESEKISKSLIEA